MSRSDRRRSVRSMMDWGERGDHMSTGGTLFMVLGMLVLLAVFVALVFLALESARA